MTETPTPDAASADGEGTRRGLFNTIIIIALLVVGLLGSWLMYEEGVKPVKPKPVTAKAAPAPQAAVEAPPALAEGNQYALQLGAFSEVAKAEELRARLERHGIPSSISVEARIQVGPFKTQEGVDAARSKLKELGLDGGSLVTIK